ncbi:MAG TPA: T9SS type A sorting domain-containing protein, partial [Firmicutes bacterium]|nr:T9SS type A sorting domain-containing protein [Bacillota bacterium]
LNSNDTWSEVSGGIVNTKNNTITVDITSFGVYAIGLGEGSKVGGGSMIPSSFNLAQNYPNPFDDSTVIKFEIGETTNISLKVYNLAGQHVSTIYEGEKQPGVYTINWDGTDDNGVKLASGLYLYTLEAGSDFKATRKMIMVR